MYVCMHVFMYACMHVCMYIVFLLKCLLHLVSEGPLAVAQQRARSMWCGRPPRSSPPAAELRISAENLSFLGAGGEKPSALDVVWGGVLGAGWVSWPVGSWLPLTWEPKSWTSVGEVWLCPLHSLRSPLVRMMRSASLR